MPANPPLTASGSRDPAKRPRPLLAKAKAMIGLMVRGDPGDDDAKPMDFIAAGRMAGLSPDVARRWLDRGDFRTALRAERRAFREAICAGNEAALQRIRDQSENAMAVVRSVQALEQIDDAETARPTGLQSPGFVIMIAPAYDPTHVIEHEAAGAPIAASHVKLGKP
jgi:hypothetical protein